MKGTNQINLLYKSSNDTAFVKATTSILYMQQLLRNSTDLLAKIALMYQERITLTLPSFLLDCSFLFDCQASRSTATLLQKVKEIYSWESWPR